MCGIVLPSRAVSKDLLQYTAPFGNEQGLFYFLLRGDSSMAYFSLKDLPEEYQKQALAQLRSYDSPLPFEPEYTNEELVRSLNSKPKSKYKAEKTEVDGMTFDSKKESVRYKELAVLEQAGEISELDTQVKFELIPAQRDSNGKVIERAITYVADFTYYDRNGQYHVEDVKGYKKGQAYALFRLKKKLLMYMKGLVIEEV